MTDDEELIEQVAREVKEGDDFAPIWDVSILLAEHEAVRANVEVGRWLSAALDDPRVCDGMKADINRWFSAGFLYLDEVRRLLEAAHTQVWNEAIEAALAEVITDQTIDKHGAHCCCTTCELNVAEAGIRALTKDSTHD